ncbi:uncharacterized protein BX663DRAFT_496790 [Cokeromyces recurvatus]|uniref:uncharacterized protein n=1 Tax=Cokeromyces recurvatus TaxID=90255 RepID=UPI00221E80C4|nr:uncharacterized protein BX663DRAFT_496790 [Cokeromyces recurvatus]KAI7906536.1 hypothetical protein BX663DRAFT_496790 [Cokeromyces recurvatus]
MYTHKPIFTDNKTSEWPLEEYEERRIMNAIIQQQKQQVSILWSNTEEEEVTSPISTCFPEKNLFTSNIIGYRRQSTSTSLRCSICQRRFHSKGNLSNHTQLYH